jgi:formate dehydrogenase major subunit
MANQHDFDVKTLRAADGPCKGDVYGLPWPCWGTPEFKHPGTPILYNTDLPVKEGGGTFRPRFGVERNGVSLLADGSYSRDSEIKDGYPEFTLAVLKKLGWDKDLTTEEMETIKRVNPANPDAVSWSIDLSGGIQRVAITRGCTPYGNGKARLIAWNLPDPIPVHRSRSTRRGPTSLRNIQRGPMPGSSGCRTWASRSRNWGSTRTSPGHSH